METIGDAYCVASGVPNPSKTEHVCNIATIALLQREVTIAAKMENSGVPDRIQMTLKSHQMLTARGIGTLLTYWLDGVEDLLKSDGHGEGNDVTAAVSASDEDVDPYSFPRESSQISSANSVVPLIP
ncbi:hypothetical protein COOONC_10769 [Cooperia oncophora]